MSQLLDETDRKTLNYLGTHISSEDIQEHRLYLSYYLQDGFISTIMLWNSMNHLSFKNVQIEKGKKWKYIQLMFDDKAELLRLLKSLTNFQHLKSLHFFYFFNSTDSLEFIGDLTNLKILHIRNFYPIKLPNSIENLTELTDLGLIFEKSVHLPNSIKNLQNLEKFQIKSSLSQFPEFVFSFRKLTQLSLRRNSLTSIPESFGDNLQNLKTLDLYENDLSSLPQSIKKLTNLTYLNIAYNHFTRLPENIKYKYLKNLETIDISYNPFISLETFKYLFSNPNLTIISDFVGSTNYKLTIEGSNMPEKVKNLWFDRNYEEILKYYTPPITEIAQKYARNPKSLTKHELERLETEATKEIRSILELSLPKNDPILKIINDKFKIDLDNGFGLMR